MIIFFAGAKEECKAEPFSDPRVAVGEELHLFTTYDEMRKGLKNKKRKRFLRGLVKRKQKGDSGKEFWKWVPGWEGKYKYSNKRRVKLVKRQATTGTDNEDIEAERILSPEKAKKFLELVK